MSDEYNDEDKQDSLTLLPVEQDTITFQGKPLVVVRLPDGRNGVVIRWICENLNLAPTGQVTRIKRTETIADDLVYVRIQTDGGPQNMPTLVLHSVPYWLATIDTRRMEKDDPRRTAILAYQREVVDLLYAWASTPRLVPASTNVVPAEPIIHPVSPGPDASVDEWIYYHQQMLSVLEWRRDVEQWRDSVEVRLEGLEAITDLIPEILERLGPEMLTVEHQRSVQGLVKRLHDATDKSYGTIYDAIKTAFQVPRYQELKEQDWEKVLHWFQVQIERAKGKQ
ncbi:MAG: phage antirepressor N-terminal domain-containing protein [Ktedonobacteraceae bacterium]